jgi:hypothetical protein
LQRRLRCRVGDHTLAAGGGTYGWGTVFEIINHHAER